MWILVIWLISSLCGSRGDTGALFRTSLPASVPQIVREVLSRSPEMQGSNALLESRQLDATNRLSALLPHLDLTSEWGVGDRVQTGIAYPWKSAFGLVLTETLYDNHRSIYRLRQGELARDLAELQLRATREQKTLSLVKVFLEWSRIKQELLNTELQNRTLSEQLGRQERLFLQGMIPERDLLRIRSQRASLSNSVLQLQTDLSLQELQLAQAGGWNSIEAFHAVVPSLEAQTLPDREDISAWFNQFFANLGDDELDPEWRSLNWTVRQFQPRSNLLEIPVSLSDRAYWPQLGVQGSVGWAVQPWFQAVPQAQGSWNWSVSASVQWNLWDWGILRRARGIARADQISGETQLSRDRLDLEFQSESISKMLKLTRQLLLQNVTILNTNRKTMQQISVAYREGTVSYLDYISALRDLLNSKNTVSAQFFTWLKWKAEALALEGRGYETWTALR